MLSLPRVIVQAPERPLPQRKDRNEVDDAHDAHQDICHIPRQIEAAQTAREDDRQTRNPKPEEQHLTLAEDELQIGLRIKVIADQAGVSKQEHCRGDEGDPHIARKVIDRHLNEACRSAQPPSGDPEP